MESAEGSADCVFCGYESHDPDGIFSEVFDALVRGECEDIALRVLTSVTEAGEFRLGPLRFDAWLRPKS